MSYCIVPGAWLELNTWSCHGNDNDGDDDGGDAT